MALSLRKEKVGLTLKKRQLRQGMARMGVALDTSGSALPMYKDGTIQDVVERLLALAIGLDDDGSMPVWDFDTQVTERPEATEANLADYVTRDILGNNPPDFGGTFYAPPIRAAQNFWFPNSKAPEPQKLGFMQRLMGAKPVAPVQPVRPAVAMAPAVLLIVTDGDNLDADVVPCERALQAAQDSKIPLYFSFIGVSPKCSFNYIRKMGDKFDNVGFLPVRDISKISDEELYEGLVSDELTRWIQASNA